MSRKVNRVKYHLDSRGIKELPYEEIAAILRAADDLIIQNNYLAIEYDYRLPLLIFTEEGWEIEKDIYSTELLNGFDKMINSGANYFNMNYLKDKNRGLIFLLLDKIKLTNDKKYIPILESWKEIDYKKVQQKINQVINSISQNAT